MNFFHVVLVILAFSAVVFFLTGSGVVTIVGGVLVGAAGFFGVQAIKNLVNKLKKRSSRTTLQTAWDICLVTFIFAVCLLYVLAIYFWMAGNQIPMAVAGIIGVLLGLLIL